MEHTHCLLCHMVMIIKFCIYDPLGDISSAYNDSVLTYADPNQTEEVSKRQGNNTGSHARATGQSAIIQLQKRRCDDGVVPNSLHSHGVNLDDKENIYEDDEPIGCIGMIHTRCNEIQDEGEMLLTLSIIMSHKQFRLS